MNKPIMKYFLYALIFNFAFIGFSGCATDKPQKAGFLSDYSKLRKSPYKDAEGAYSYFNQKTPLKNYSRFIVNPVQIRLSPKGKERDVDRSKLQEVASYFHKQIMEELKKSDYNIVNKPGPNTLVVRVALTEVIPAKIALNIHPAMIISGVGLGGASMEAEAIDALSGEVVGAVIDSMEGGRGFDGFTKYGNAKDVTERWAKRFIVRLDEAHGKTRK